jgi:hypothetical protein
LASQSLARDLTLSSEYELLQQFVPELQMLRIPGSRQDARLTLLPSRRPQQQEQQQQRVEVKGSMQLEVVATFSWENAATMPQQLFGFTFLSGAGNVTIDCSNTTENDPNGEAPGGCMVGKTSIQIDSCVLRS